MEGDLYGYNLLRSLLLLNEEEKRRISMFQYILVPLDGSARAEQALPVAVRLARPTHATLILLQVISPPSAFMKRVGEIVLPTLLDEDELAARAYLDSVAQVGMLEGIATAIHVQVGHPAQEILRATHVARADLLVLCSHGETDPIQGSIGSIAQRVIQHASLPVLLLHEGRLLWIESATTSADSIRILTPLDGTKFSEEVLTYAFSLA